MVTRPPNRPHADPLLRYESACLHSEGLLRMARACGQSFSAWNAQGRGMCRAAQPARAAGGSEADPGAARSRPPRRPLTVHMR
jgi:hypothetical protein